MPFNCGSAEKHRGKRDSAALNWCSCHPFRGETVPVFALFICPWTLGGGITFIPPCTTLLAFSAVVYSQWTIPGSHLRLWSHPEYKFYIVILVCCNTVNAGFPPSNPKQYPIYVVLNALYETENWRLDVSWSYAQKSRLLKLLYNKAVNSCCVSCQKRFALKRRKDMNIFSTEKKDLCFEYSVTIS